jgi:hypothetical protein
MTCTRLTNCRVSVAPTRLQLPLLDPQSGRFPRKRGVGIPSTVAAVYFKSEDDGDGTYEGQIGHAYLHLDDGSTGDEGRDLGFITLTAAAEIAKRQGAELDIDGPTREEWDAAV